MVMRDVQRLEAAVAFIALHGTFGEDGTIQRLCEELPMPYTGSDARASRLGMDKVASRQRFEHAGLSVPRWRTVDVTASARHRAASLKGLSYPLIVKPIAQGSSLGVTKVRDLAQLPAALAAAGAYGTTVLVEEFVAGREVTAGVLGDEALPVVEIRSRHGFFDFHAKYTAGATEYLVPAPLPDPLAHAVQAAGLSAHRVLGCRHLSRADIIVTDEGRPIILEVNTIPGFTPTSLLPKAAASIGISYDELCEQLVLMARQGISHAVHAAAAVL